MKGSEGGDFAVDFFDGNNNIQLKDDAPILIVMHGLSGGSNEPMVQKLGLKARDKGWRV
ncbi:MAG: hypothetical protein EZS28_018124, partial [Streblomastix strix]